MQGNLSARRAAPLLPERRAPFVLARCVVSPTTGWPLAAGCGDGLIQGTA